MLIRDDEGGAHTIRRSPPRSRARSTRRARSWPSVQRPGRSCARSVGGLKEGRAVRSVSTVPIRIPTTPGPGWGVACGARRARHGATVPREPGHRPPHSRSAGRGDGPARRPARLGSG